jgi:hypothetical protein
MPDAGSGHGRADARDSSDSPHDCPSIWRPRRPPAALLDERTKQRNQELSEADGNVDVMYGRGTMSVVTIAEAWPAAGRPFTVTIAPVRLVAGLRR